jgi:1-phosphofructokinase family hexose kinase
MIVTVTPNTGLDRVIFVRDFEMGKTIRAHGSAWGMGGKASDASLVLGEIGEPNLATGFAAGDIGERMVEMLEQHPATEARFEWVDGETRTNYVLVDTARKVQSTITVAGLMVKTEHLDAFHLRFEEMIVGAECVIMGGSLPDGVPVDFYQGLIAQVKEAGIPVILDTSGEALRVSVEAGPDIIKPNQDELAFLAGRALPEERDVVEAAQALLDHGITWVIATVGAGGLWAISRDYQLYAPPLPINPVNTAGAGDALAAGIATGFARNWDWEEGLRLGLAAAGAVCLTPGTAICNEDEIERLITQVRLEERALPQ